MARTFPPLVRSSARCPVHLHECADAEEDEKWCPLSLLKPKLCRCWAKEEGKRRPFSADEHYRSTRWQTSNPLTDASPFSLHCEAVTLLHHCPLGAGKGKGGEKGESGRGSFFARVRAGKSFCLAPTGLAMAKPSSRFSLSLSQCRKRMACFFP